MKLTLVALILFSTLATTAPAQTIVPLRSSGTPNPQGLSVRSARRSSQPSGFLETRIIRVWVPAQRTVSVDASGFTTVRILPGYFEYRQVQVWVPNAQQQVPVVNPVPSRPGYMHPMNTWRSRP
jgi:hypothetical protein